MFPIRSLCTCRQLTSRCGIVVSVIAVAMAMAQSLTAQDQSTPARTSAWIQAGDRVAWIGGQLWERQQEQADLEVLLAIRVQGLGVSFRNVAWSGDDVTGRARALFGTPEDGYQRRLNDLKLAKPTVVFVAYGQSEALDSQYPIDKFREGLTRLVDDLLAAPYRVVLLQPFTIPDGVSFLGDRQQANARIAQYGMAIQEIAQAKKLAFLELPSPNANETNDGITLHPAGMASIAQRWADKLLGNSTSATEPPDAIVLRRGQSLKSQNNWELASSPSSSEASASSDVVRWEEKFASVPERSNSRPTADGRILHQHRKVQIVGLDPGNYVLSIDDQPVAKGNQQDWSDGQYLSGYGADQQRAALQKSLVRNHQFFMYRYRPHNETYLLLFRKHEQGRNAPELERFDQLTANQDADIISLAQPRTHRWELKKVD